jgi:hypothetical protein
MTEPIEQEEPTPFKDYEIEQAQSRLYDIAWAQVREQNEKRRWSAQPPLPENIIEQQFFWQCSAIIKQLQRDLMEAKVQLADAQAQLAIVETAEPVKRLKRKSDAS